MKTTLHRFAGHTHGSSSLWQTWASGRAWMDEVVAAIRGRGRRRPPPSHDRTSLARPWSTPSSTVTIRLHAGRRAVQHRGSRSRRLGAPVTFVRRDFDRPARATAPRPADEAGVVDRGDRLSTPRRPLALVAPAETATPITASTSAAPPSRPWPASTPPRSDAGVVLVGSLALALDPPGTRIEAFALDAARRCSLVLDPNVRPSLMTDRKSYREAVRAARRRRRDRQAQSRGRRVAVSRPGCRRARGRTF